MAMVSISEQRVLQHHHPHEGRLPLSSQPPFLRHHQLKLPIRGVLQDVYNCKKLIPRQPIVESFCQVVLRDVNQSSFSYEKVSLRTNLLYKTADALWVVHGQSTIEQPRSHARIAASLDSDAGKAEGARKALEQAFQGKDNLAKKWEEEIRKRELSGGDGSSGGSGGRGGGGGGSWGGGGGDEEMGEDFGQDEPWDWEEAGQTFMATFALLILYISITHGPKQVLKKFKLLFRYIRQGFRLRKIPEEYLTAEGSGIPSDDEEVDDDEIDDEDDEDAAAEFLRRRRAEISASANGARDADKNGADDYDETEDDEEIDMPTPPKQQREDLLSKRQAEHKEKLLQMLTPKELRQQQQEEKKKS